MEHLQPPAVPMAIDMFRVASSSISSRLRLILQKHRNFVNGVVDGWQKSHLNRLRAHSTLRCPFCWQPVLETVVCGLGPQIGKWKATGCGVTVCIWCVMSRAAVEPRKFSYPFSTISYNGETPCQHGIHWLFGVTGDRITRMC